MFNAGFAPQLKPHNRRHALLRTETNHEACILVIPHRSCPYRPGACNRAPVTFADHEVRERTTDCPCQPLPGVRPRADLPSERLLGQVRHGGAPPSLEVRRA